MKGYARTRVHVCVAVEGEMGQPGLDDKEHTHIHFTIMMVPPRFCPTGVTIYVTVYLRYHN